MHKTKKRLEIIGLIVPLACACITVLFIYLANESGNKIYDAFATVVIIIGLFSSMIVRMYHIKQKRIVRINRNLKKLKLTDEEIEKRQGYLINQSSSKLLEIEKILTKKLKPKPKSKTKPMSDDEFFEPLKSKEAEEHSDVNEIYKKFKNANK